MTQEDRAAVVEHVSQMEKEDLASRERVRNAANQMLEASSQLHLTWDEFEKAVAAVKKRGRIC